MYEAKKMYGATFRGKEDLDQALLQFEIPGLDSGQCKALLQLAWRGIRQYQASVQQTWSGELRDHSLAAASALHVIDAYLAWARSGTKTKELWDLTHGIVEMVESLLLQSRATPEAVEKADYLAKLEQLLMHLKLIGPRHGAISISDRYHSATEREDPAPALLEFIKGDWRRVIADVHNHIIEQNRAETPPTLPTAEGIACARRLLAVKAALQPPILEEVPRPQLPSS